MSDKPLTDLLREHGYGHESTQGLKHTNKHRVFRLDTGETVGEFDAFEAFAFLKRKSARETHE